MKGVRFQKTKVGVLIDITCVCGYSFMINETTGLERSYRHLIRLSKNGTSTFFRCERCNRRYEVRSEYDHIHVEEIEDTIDQSIDWTVDPSTGRSNSSPKFLELCNKVEQIICNNGHSLINGNTGAIARLVMSHLSHVHHLTPLDQSN